MNIQFMQTWMSYNSNSVIVNARSNKGIVWGPKGTLTAIPADMKDTYGYAWYI